MEKKYKILQIGGGNFVGGGRSKIIYELCECLDKEKYEVYYHLVNPLAEELKPVIKNVIYTPSKYKNKVLRIMNDSYCYVKTLRQFKFDIIHFNTDSVREQWRYIVLSILFSDSKIVIHGHSTNSSKSEKVVKLYRNLFMKFFRKRVALFLACSEEAAEFLVGKTYVDDVVVLKNGIVISKYKYDPAIRNIMRKSLNIDDSTLVLGSVGRLSLYKNFDYLIRIYSELQKKIPDSKLLIIGEGEMRDSLQKTIDELGLTERVCLLGMKNNVNEYLQAFDVFCLTTLFEGFGIVNIEAQAAGLPCVISNGCPKAVDLTGEVLFLSVDMLPGDWSEAIFDFLQNHDRYDKCQMIKDKGYDLLDSALRLQQLYDAILD